MSNDPKFTWGDSVAVADSDQFGSICGITESENSISYTVEFADGTDKLIEESLLSLVPESDI